MWFALRISRTIKLAAECLLVVYKVEMGSV